MSLHFASPWALLAAIPAYWALFRTARRPGAALRYSSLLILKDAQGPDASRARTLLLLLRALALLFLILALARPQAGKKLTEITTEGVDIMLAIDTSRSMEAMDFRLGDERAPRLEVVKKVVQDFIRQQNGNRLGLVVFGSEAFTQCPLTLDYGVLPGFVERLQTGMAGDATAIGSAIGVAAKRMKDLESKSKVIVLLTDGASNAGPVGPLEAADAAAAFGIRIYTVGIGSEGLAPMRRNTILGPILEQVRVEFDEDTLKEIARRTKGQYFKATDTDTLEHIYETIDQLEKTEQKIKEHMEYHELYVGFVLAGLFALLLEILLAQTRLRELP